MVVRPVLVTALVATCFMLSTQRSLRSEDPTPNHHVTFDEVEHIFHCVGTPINCINDA